MSGTGSGWTPVVAEQVAIDSLATGWEGAAGVLEDAHREVAGAAAGAWSPGVQAAVTDFTAAWDRDLDAMRGAAVDASAALEATARTYVGTDDAVHDLFGGGS